MTRWTRAALSALLISLCLPIVACAQIIQQPPAGIDIASSANPPPAWVCPTLVYEFEEGVDTIDYDLSGCCRDPKIESTTVSLDGTLNAGVTFSMGVLTASTMAAAMDAPAQAEFLCSDATTDTGVALQYRVIPTPPMDLEIGFAPAGDYNHNEGETLDFTIRRGDGNGTTDEITADFTITGDTAATSPDTGTVTIGVGESEATLTITAALVTGADGAYTLTLDNPANVTTPGNPPDLGLAAVDATILNLSDPTPGAATFSDDFDRADGALGANWENIVASHVIATNNAIGGAASNNVSRVATGAAAFDADHEATVTGQANAQAIRPATRVSASGGYLGLCGNALAYSLRGIYEFDAAGTATRFLITDDVACGAGQTVTLRSSGIEHCLFRGVQNLGCANDDTFATGQPGIHSFGTTGAVSDFVATDVTPPVPAGSFSDDFDRANAATLGASWEDTSGGHSISTNAAVGDTAGTNISRVATTAATFDDDHEATITFGSNVNSSRVGTRLSADGDGIIFVCRATNDGAQGIYRADNGVLTLLLTTTGAETCTTGGTARLASNAENHTAYVGATEVGTVADATYTTGQPGIQTFATGGNIASFSAQDYVPPPPPPPPGDWVWDNELVSATTLVLTTPTTYDLSVTPLLYTQTQFNLTCTGQVHRVVIPAGQDAIVTMSGGTPLTYPVTIVGGRNVKVIGLHIEIETQAACAVGSRPNRVNGPCATFSAPCGTSGTFAPYPMYSNIHPRAPNGMALRTEQTHATWVEGVYMDVNGHNIDCWVPRNTPGMTAAQGLAQRKFYYINSHCTGIEGHGVSQYGDADHADFWQHQGGYVSTEQWNTIVIENFSGRSNLEGFVITANNNVTKQSQMHLRRADMSIDTRWNDADGAEQWGLVLDTSGIIDTGVNTFTLEDVYIQWNGSTHYLKVNTQRYGNPSNGVVGCTNGCIAPHAGVFQGYPPDSKGAEGGYFAPEAYIGVNYESPF